MWVYIAQKFRNVQKMALLVSRPRLSLL